ncbi:MAG: DUF4367 domain-containing protein [Clostridia bacterium]|nr:DUF4367 domain-containing protein [Clostridia bacterium]
MNDKKFEELLGKAFEIEQNNEVSREPSEEELFEAAPFGEKQLEYVKSVCQKDKKFPWTKHVARAAAILLCVSLAGFGLLMIDPGIRATVGDNITRFVDEYINIDFSESSKEHPVDISKTEIGYVPEGFELCEDLSDDEKISLVYADDDNYLFIDIVSSGEILISYELDEHNVTYLKINGYDGYVTYDEVTAQGSVCWGNSSFTVVISGFTSRNELIKVAESISFTR